jgi:hypothetical protein
MPNHIKKGKGRVFWDKGCVKISEMAAFPSPRRVCRWVTSSGAPPAAAKNTSNQTKGLSNFLCDP